MIGYSFRFVREIYSTHIWMMHPEVFSYYRGIMETARLYKESVTEFEEKAPSQELLVFSSVQTEPAERLIQTASVRGFDMWGDLQPLDQIIDILHLEGPITHNGDYCTAGTLELADNLRYADAHAQVIGHLVIIDTPGGSAYANDLDKAFQEAKKPVVALIRGMNASKGVWISSFIPHVFAEREDVEIGSIGSLCSIYGQKNGELENNRVYYEIYADNSEFKNHAFREAVQNNNLKPAIEELNSLTSSFQTIVRNRWPQIGDDKLTGKMYKASEVIGELVDGIKSYAECVDLIFDLAGVERYIQGIVTPRGIPNPSPEIEQPLEIKKTNENNNPKILTPMTDISALETILGKGNIKVDENGNPQLTEEQLRQLNDSFSQAQSAGTVIANQQAAIVTQRQQLESSSSELDNLRKQLAEKDKMIKEMANATSMGIPQPPVQKDSGAEPSGHRLAYPMITNPNNSDFQNIAKMNKYLKEHNYL